MRYRDRRDAGRQLAGHLRGIALADPVVLALPRGGVPVAAEVARSLGAPLDVVVARKVGAPGHPEYAIGAIAEGGGQVRDDAVLAALGLDELRWEELLDAESAELARRVRAYRGDRPLPEVTGRDVVVVDDGIATGSTVRAAVASLRRAGAGRVVVAVPVGPPDLDGIPGVDEVVCPLRPRSFVAVGAAYDDFSQTDDAEVRAALAEHRGPPPDV